MTAEPSPSVTVTSPEAARSTRVAFWLVRMSTPCSASASVTSSQAKSSSLPSSRCSPSISVTCAPSDE